MSLAVLAAAHGATTAQDISIGHVLLQMVVALAIVVGGIWGFGKVMRRSPRRRRPGVLGRARGAEHGLRVLSRQAVGKGKSIAVVQAGEQCFLVGIADSGLTPLGELKGTGGSGEDGAAVGGPPRAKASGAAVGSPPVAEASWGEPAATGARPLALAPIDLSSVDLSAFDRAATSGTGHGGGGAAAGPGRAAGANGGAPAKRAWLDALREATVRR